MSVSVRTVRMLMGLLVALALVLAATPQTHAASATKPATPHITKIKGGDYARIDFADGRAHWDKVQAHAKEIEHGTVVEHCSSKPIRTKGSWIGYYPAGPGHWSFAIRVHTSSGWSAWSSWSQIVPIGVQ